MCGRIIPLNSVDVYVKVVLKSNQNICANVYQIKYDKAANTADMKMVYSILFFLHVTSCEVRLICSHKWVFLSESAV